MSGKTCNVSVDYRNHMDTETILIREFLAEVDNYQENHFGHYPRGRLVNSYRDLPDELKIRLTPARTKQNRLWHCCDGFSEKRCISFSTDKDYLRAAYRVPFREIKSHSGLIDIGEVYKLSLRHEGFEIGDDEREVIVISPVWSDSLELIPKIPD